ncbi:MAG TPA: hypothetical protein VMR98_04060 [Candidatus Polarisedimenticolaceae bacterium]|nr:hypothetical protein [Candidatus Polarisedimenticolaceae bacterium]
MTRARTIGMTIAAAICLTMFMPTITTQLGSQNSTSQAHDAIGAMRYALKVAKLSCVAADKGVLVYVRGLPIKIILYNCDSYDMTYLCQKRTRANNTKVYTCGVEFFLKAMVPVGKDEAYYHCTRDLILSPRQTRDKKEYYRIVKPFFKWICDPSASGSPPAT